MGTNGYELWRGPTEMPGHTGEVVVVGTGYYRASSNRKTGPAIQVWILSADAHPLEAIRTGEDAVICGDCPLRGELGKARGCYVAIHQAPARVWRTWADGGYPKAHDMYHTGRAVRLGAYGDPAALPLDVVERLLWGSTWTAYTHQWRVRPDLRPWCMASVETEAAGLEAHNLGWRTFRIVRSTDDLLTGEILCPASREAGELTTCHRCHLCSGARDRDQRKNIAVVGHGIGKASALRLTGGA